MIVILIFILNSGEKEPERILKVSLSSVSSIIEPGDSLKFSIRLIDKGKDDYDVTIDLINSGGMSVATKRETFRKTESSKKISLDVPLSTSGGNYNLKVAASYKDESAKAYSNIIIKKKIEAPEENVSDNNVSEEETPDEEIPFFDDSEIPDSLGCPSSCDDSNVCTESYCSAATGFECVANNIIPCCGNNICEGGENYNSCSNDCNAPQQEDEEQPSSVREVISEVKTKTAISPGEAAGYCSSLVKENYKDSCYSALAKEIKDSSYCDLIISESKRDNCYTTFALDGDYSVCEKITNKYLKQSCIALSQSG